MQSFLGNLCKLHNKTVSIKTLLQTHIPPKGGWLWFLRLSCHDCANTANLTQSSVATEFSGKISQHLSKPLCLILMVFLSTFPTIHPFLITVGWTKCVYWDHVVVCFLHGGFEKQKRTQLDKNPLLDSRDTLQGIENTHRNPYKVPC